MQDLEKTSLPQYVTLAHGNGGRYMRELIDEMFARHLDNPLLDTHLDAAILELPVNKIAFTTDGFTVKPLEFPGGTIGSLAIHGTINDLAVSGAIPKYLSLNVFIEEGLEFAQLERIIKSMAQAAFDAEVQIVTGDTKVLPRGEIPGVFFATSGIGIIEHDRLLGMDQIRPGDQILLSGSVGVHGTAVMLAREQFGLKGELLSDSASVFPFTQSLLAMPGVRFMRDPTRGGLASVCNEIASAIDLEVRLMQTQIPVQPQVESVCEILGYDPYYLASEGRVVAIVSPESAAQAVQLWQQYPNGEDAAVIGEIRAGKGKVILQTELGGERFLDELEDDPLPRIC